MIDTGGQVYPNKMMEMIEIYQGCGREKVEVAYPGISRRDWLAGMAMHGILLDPSRQTDDFGRVTSDAYRYADVMILKSKLDLTNDEG